jgi:hypothetical protein
MNMLHHRKPSRAAQLAIAELDRLATHIADAKAAVDRISRPRLTDAMNEERDHLLRALASSLQGLDFSAATEQLKRVESRWRKEEAQSR